jgi:hypothetical protein
VSFDGCGSLYEIFLRCMFLYERRWNWGMEIGTSFGIYFWEVWIVDERFPEA